MEDASSRDPVILADEIIASLEAAISEPGRVKDCLPTWLAQARAIRSSLADYPPVHGKRQRVYDLMLLIAEAILVFADKFGK